jgi:hypothetical protein
MHLSPASHLDHALTPAHVAWLLERLGPRAGFFVETIELPPALESLPCGLHGPVLGDAPLADDETTLAVRGARAWPSRLCQRPCRPSRLLTVIAGPDEEGETVLYTAFGGPCAPREPGDPSLAEDAQGLAESQAFWATHALSA